MFQVGLGAEFSQGPLRKLTAKKDAEALAEDEASAAAPHFRSGAAGKIEQEHLPFASAEALDGKLQARCAVLANVHHTARQIARAIPSLEREAIGAQRELVILTGEREQLFAGFEQCGLACALEESLDGITRGFGASAGGPGSGGHEG